MKKRSLGFSLAELMVATTIATLMSMAVLAVYINQTSSVLTETERDTSIQEANRAFDKVSRLLRQAEKKSIKFAGTSNTKYNDENTPEISDDALTINFMLPNGFNIWPNNQEPFDKNKISIRWTNQIDTAHQHAIQIANGVNFDALGNYDTIAGGADENDNRIVNLDIWPLLNQNTIQSNLSQAANSGYVLKVTSKTAHKDMSFTNPDESNTAQKNYRTFTVTGIIAPRN